MEIERNGGSAFTVGAQFGSFESIKNFYQSLDRLLMQRTGDSRLDILVNNAGASLVAPIETTEEASFDKVMSINVKTPFS